MPERLARPVAVITGGAGGIGGAICQALAAAGLLLVVGYRSSAAAAQALAQALPGSGHLALKAPVTDRAALEAMAGEVQGRFGRCDVLVNCAGTTRFVPHADLEGLDDALIDDILSINVRGPVAAGVDPIRYTGRTLSITVSCAPPPLDRASSFPWLHRRAVSRGCGRSLSG
jgi:3-oxoacyl-[acyl-carrier protein] reductase